MNWSLVLKLSLFGLAMGFFTVSVIPPSVEPLVWLAIFVYCAYVIAKRLAAKHFVHGLCVSLANGVWITAAHVLFVERYLANHADGAAMMASMPMPDSPRLMMLVTGPAIALVSGLVLGLFALVASKFVKTSVAAR